MFSIDALFKESQLTIQKTSGLNWGGITDPGNMESAYTLNLASITVIFLIKPRVIILSYFFNIETGAPH
jgi:hypothetical protein